VGFPRRPATGVAVERGTSQHSRLATAFKDKSRRIDRRFARVDTPGERERHKKKD
jgi:hypothetical protein